jgi:hypothetical protein
MARGRLERTFVQSVGSHVVGRWPFFSRFSAAVCAGSVCYESCGVAISGRLLHGLLIYLLYDTIYDIDGCSLL